METEIYIPCEKSVVIKQIYVKKDRTVNHGTILCSYQIVGKTDLLKLRSPSFGTVSDICFKKDDTVECGKLFMKLMPCQHSIVMKDMCAECGEDLREKYGVAGDRKKKASATVAMVHNIPELHVSGVEAQELGAADEERLLSTRKLALLVDLDETLLHTTNDNVPANLKDVYHFQLPHGSSHMWYHTKIRPGTHEFLEKMSKLYELHICTFGVRMYAHTLAKYLDPEKKLFSYRILSRDECFDSRSKQANLRALFPNGDGLVCIIDDREEVWNFTSNMVKVKPYHFFAHTADIHAPPGLARSKSENDAADGAMDKRVVKVHKVPKSKDKKVASAEKKEKAVAKTKQTQSEITSTETAKEPENIKNKDNYKTTTSTHDASSMIKSEDNAKPLNSSSSEIASEETIGTDNKVAEVISDNADKVPTKQNEDNDKVSEPTDDSSGKQTDSLSTKEDVTSETTVSCPEEDMNISTDALNTKDESTANIAESKESSPSVPDMAESKTSEKDDTEADRSESKTSEQEDTKSDRAESKTSEKEDSEEYEEIIEWEDTDDYLLYLEEILTRIHHVFYTLYDEYRQNEASSTQSSERPKTADQDSLKRPSLKKVVPYAKMKVLQGTRIVFSGVVPTNMPMEKSRPYKVALNLGAEVQTELVTTDVNRTTHVVAAKRGTAKVNEALKYKDMCLVTPDWLWSCEWRWERVDERLFFLDTKEEGLKRRAGDSEQTPSKRSKPTNLKRSAEDTGLPDEKNHKRSKPDLPSTGESNENNDIEDDETIDSNSSSDTDKTADDKAPTQSSDASKIAEASSVSSSENTDSYSGSASTEAVAGTSGVATGAASSIGDARRFSETINPLALLSREDLESLSREVDEISDASNDSDEGESKTGSTSRDGHLEAEETDEDGESEESEHLGSHDTASLRQQVLGHSSPETSSDESMSGDYPQGWRPRSSSRSPSREREDHSHLLQIDDPTEARLALLKSARSSNDWLFEEDSRDGKASEDEEKEDSQDSGDDELAAAIERRLFS